jgi:hypothetical protein
MTSMPVKSLLLVEVADASIAITVVNATMVSEGKSEMPVTTTPDTPVRTSPSPSPWREVYTSPDRICPQQRRESASPDVAP